MDLYLREARESNLENPLSPPTTSPKSVSHLTLEVDMKRPSRGSTPHPLTLLVIHAARSDRAGSDHWPPLGKVTDIRCCTLHVVQHHRKRLFDR